MVEAQGHGGAAPFLGSFIKVSQGERLVLVVEDAEFEPVGFDVQVTPLTLINGNGYHIRDRIESGDPLDGVRVVRDEGEQVLFADWEPHTYRVSVTARWLYGVHLTFRWYLRVAS